MCLSMYIYHPNNPSAVLANQSEAKCHNFYQATAESHNIRRPSTRNVISGLFS